MDSHALTYHAQNQLNLVYVQLIYLLVVQNSIFCHRVADWALKPLILLQPCLLKTGTQTCLALDLLSGGRCTVCVYLYIWLLCYLDLLLLSYQIVTFSHLMCDEAVKTQQDVRQRKFKLNRVDWLPINVILTHFNPSTLSIPAIFLPGLVRGRNIFLFLKKWRDNAWKLLWAHDITLVEKCLKFAEITFDELLRQLIRLFVREAGLEVLFAEVWVGHEQFVLAVVAHEKEEGVEALLEFVIVVRVEILLEEGPVVYKFL